MPKNKPVISPEEQTRLEHLWYELNPCIRADQYGKRTSSPERTVMPEDNRKPVNKYMTAKEKEIITKWLDKQDDPFGCLRAARNVCNIEYLVWFVLKQGPILARKNCDNL